MYQYQGIHGVPLSKLVEQTIVVYCHAVFKASASPILLFFVSFAYTKLGPIYTMEAYRELTAAAIKYDNSITLCSVYCVSVNELYRSYLPHSSAAVQLLYFTSNHVQHVPVRQKRSRKVETQRQRLRFRWTGELYDGARYDPFTDTKLAHAVDGGVDDLRTPNRKHRFRAL
jgi:hypothetical protein